MLRRFIAWFQGLVVTLDIMIFDPELYEELTRTQTREPQDLSNFREAGRPGE